jgi:hypothetical protein
MVQRKFENELRRRRHAQLSSRERRHGVEVLFDRLQNRMRVQFDVTQDFGEHVPLDLRKRKEDMFVAKKDVLAASGFLKRTVDDPLCAFGEFAR